MLLLIQGHFCRSPQVAVVDEQAVKIPANPIIIEITACAILHMAASGTVSTWRRVGGGGLLPGPSAVRALARACTWSENMLAGWAAADGARFHA